MRSHALKNRVLEWMAPLCIAAVLGGCMTVDEQPPSPEAGVAVTQQALSSQVGNWLHLELREETATDTFIRSGSNTNYGGETSMDVGRSSTGVETRSLLWFDLGQLPRAAGTTPRIRVDDALLRLHLVSPVADRIPYAISNAGRSWVEGRHVDTSTCTAGANWNRPNCATTTAWVGGDFVTPNIATSAFETDFDFEFVTIPTSRIIGYNTGTAYNGWVLRTTSATEADTARIFTREGTAGEEPELEIDYACLPGYENDIAFGPGGCTGSRGSVCSNNGQCASGVCSAGVCLADSRMTCTANSQCVNNRCVNGRCEGFNARFTADKDTYVNNLWPSANRGAAEELLAGRVPSEVTVLLRTILDFTPTTPEHAIIDSVQVRLTQVQAAGDASVTAHLRTIPIPWTEGGGSGTSTTCGGGGATEQRSNCINNTPWTLGSPVAASVASIALDSNSGQKVWNLPTSEIVAMRSSGHQGYLLDIGSPSLGTTRWFTSAEGSAKWGNTLPTLSVNYRCAPGYTAGGPACLGEATAACTTDAECGGGNCDNGVCCMTSCADIECGNACGRPCNKPACPTGSVCGGGQCIDHCFDGIRSGNELGEDCGGRCARSCFTNCTCDPTSECGNTDTCGGATCGSCAAGEVCRVYELDHNRWGVCYDHCSDGLLNHGETQVDCGGGGCEPCAGSCSCVGRACGADDGCGNVCDGTCATVTEPASATLPLQQDDTARGAAQRSLGDVDTRWFGARGTTVGMADDAPAVCGASDTGRDVYYHFRVCSPTSVSIYTNGAWTAHALALFPATRASFTTPIACSASRRIEEFLEPGDYYVLVKGTGSTTGTFNLYIRDDDNYQTTCGGGGVPGVCGSFNECADSLEERKPLERAQNHLGEDIVVRNYTDPNGGHEGRPEGLEMVFSTNINARSSLFFDSFEFGQRWAVQSGAAGSVALLTGVSSPDTFTSRPSTRVARLAGNVWMKISVPVVNVDALQLRLSTRTQTLLNGENLYVQWSTDGVLWTDLITHRGTNPAMSTVQANFTVDRRIDTVHLRLRTNAASTARYADVDNVQLRAQGVNASYADVQPRTRPVANQVTWSLCDDEGNPQSGDDTTVLSAPAATDFCPAIAGPCRCAEDPGSASAQDTCTTDQDCNADQRCSRLAGVYCSLVTGQSSCPTDAEGYLTTRYCTRPYPSCGSQPALGCFSGTIQLPTGDGNMYSACANPAETPCKVVNDCPADDLGGVVQKDELPDAVVPVDSPGSVKGLSERATFDPLETSTAGICNMEMAADNANFIRHVSSPGCTSGEGRLGTAPVPSDIVKYSNCSNSVNPAPVRNMGDETKFDIDMTPNVYKVIMFRDLPLGEAQYMVDTGVSWEIAPIVWGNKFTLFGVDAGASLDRCEIGVRTDVTLLDQDIDVSELANSLTDSETFPLATDGDVVKACQNILGLPKTVAQVREELASECLPSDLPCIDEELATSGFSIPGYFANQSSNGLIIRANKAKKALTDARHAINYWNALPDNRSMQTVGGLCAYTKLYFHPDAHPGTYNEVQPNAECGVNIINAWINEYRMAMTQLGNLGPTTPSETEIGLGAWNPNLQGGFQLVDEQVRYDVLAVSFAFPIGPLSALLEVSAGGTYGIAGRIDYSTKPSGLVMAPSNESSSEIARASATLTPGVSAVVTLFVGAGIGNQFVGAHIGVQGDLELVALSLPMEGVAELNRKRKPDDRDIVEPWASVQETYDPLFGSAPPYFESQRYINSYDANWYLNGYADIDLLNGSISLAARLRLLFYTLQFSKEMVDWEGINERITLVDLNNATGPEQPDPKTEVPADLGTFAVTTPFPVISNLVTDVHRNMTQETLNEQNSRLPLGSHLFGWNQQCILPTHTVD